jgi:hypothetical protein
VRISRTVAIASALLFGSSWALAADKDQTALNAAVDRIIAGGSESPTKLKALIDKCKSCTGRDLGRAYGALGMLEKGDDAKKAWADALTYDPNVEVKGDGFADARKAWASVAPAEDDTRRAGWLLKPAYAGFKDAFASSLASKWQECVDKAQASITIEENANTRMLRAVCEDKTGSLVEALKDNAKALDRAKQLNDAALIKTIQDRVTLLLPRLGHLKIERPVEVVDLKVLFDDRPIPEARLIETFTVDPGKHKIHAEGTLRGGRVFDDEEVTVKEGEIATAKIKMVPAAMTQGQLDCMANAKSQEEVLMCLPQQQKALVAHAALEMSGYTDSIDVHVLSPALRASVASPTQGWNIGAAYLIDVVTAASPDVISTASHRFQDVRHDVSLTGGYKPGNFGAQVSGNYSTEHDYVSRTIGITGIGDFNEKAVSPSLGYAFTSNTIGRAGTDYDSFSHDFAVHDITATSTFLVSPLSLFVVGAEAQLEVGDQSKPYRYIPLFEPGVTVPVGASIDEVNKARLPAKPLEQLPLSRQRLALTGRYIRRIDGRATLRLEERVYRDTWNITATTTDARYLIDFARLRVGPHVHFHAQTPAKFYRRIYGAILDADGFATVPVFRTSDRELGPFFGATLGGSARYALTPAESKIQLGLYASGDLLWDHYLDALYIKDRFAGYGTVGVEADFE